MKKIIGIKEGKVKTNVKNSLSTKRPSQSPKPIKFKIPTEEEFIKVLKIQKEYEAIQEKLKEEKFRKSLITNEACNGCGAKLIYETNSRHQFHNTDSMHIPFGVKFEYTEYKTGNNPTFISV